MKIYRFKNPRDCPKREDYLPYCDPCTQPLCGDVIEPDCPPIPCPPDTPRGRHQRKRQRSRSRYHKVAKLLGLR